MSFEDVEEAAFHDVPGLIGRHARQRPAAVALVEGDRRLDYEALDAWMDRVAAALQHEGLGPGDVIALCGTTSIEYLGLFLGALRAGLAVAPLAPAPRRRSWPPWSAMRVRACSSSMRKPRHRSMPPAPACHWACIG